MWTYDGKEFDETPEEYQGFVYEITELDTGMKYIGKKFFWKPKKLPVTKTRRRAVRTRSERVLLTLSVKYLDYVKPKGNVLTMK
jgi:hypothetical protein